MLSGKVHINFFCGRAAPTWTQPKCQPLMSWRGKYNRIRFQLGSEKTFVCATTSYLGVEVGGRGTLSPSRSLGKGREGGILNCGFFGGDLRLKLDSDIVHHKNNKVLDCGLVVRVEVRPWLWRNSLPGPGSSLPGHPRHRTSPNPVTASIKLSPRHKLATGQLKILLTEIVECDFSKNKWSPTTF